MAVSEDPYIYLRLHSVFKTKGLMNVRSVICNEQKVELQKAEWPKNGVEKRPIRYNYSST